MQKRMTANARRVDVLAAAVRRSVDIGYNKITRDEIALAANCSPALVSQYLGTMVSMRRAIMRAAITNEVLPVIAQGLSVRDPHALRAPEHVRHAAARSLMGRSD